MGRRSVKMGRGKKNKGAEGEGAEGEGGSQREQHGSGDNDYDLPSSSLLLFSGQLLVTAGSHFHVHDLKAPGPATFSSASSADAHKSGAIRDIGVSADAKFLVTGGDDKEMKVWRVADWQLHQSCALSKKATAVIVTDDGKYVAGADKFGEVAYMEVADEPRGKIPAEFCLGHMSIVTCMAVLPGGRGVITGDRDSSIRTSCFPDGFNVEAFCLGHSTWVSQITLPAGHEELLFSGDGGGELILWEHMQGKLLDKQSLLIGGAEACAVTAMAFDSTSQLLAVALGRTIVFVRLEERKFTQVNRFEANHAVSSLCFDGDFGCLWAAYCAIDKDGAATPHVAAFSTADASSAEFSAVPDSHAAHAVCAAINTAVVSNIEGLAQVAGVTQRQWVERPVSGPAATAKKQKTA